MLNNMFGHLNWLYCANLVGKSAPKLSMILCGLSLFVISNSHATTASQVESLSLVQLIEQVSQYQKQQSLWSTQAAIANENIKNSRLWENPSISIEQTGFKNGKGQELAIGITQSIDIFGKKRAMQAIAELAQKQLPLKERIYDEQLQMIVKSLWSQMMLLKVEVVFLKEQLEVSQESLNAAEKRLQAGSVAQVDVDRIRLAHLENLKLLQQSNLSLDIQQKQLANLMGKSTGIDVQGFDLQSLWPEETAKNVEKNHQDNVQEKLLQFQIQETDANINLLKVKSRPNPELSLGTRQTKNPKENTEQQLVLGINIPLAIFNRQQYGIQIAQAKEALLVKQQKFYKQQNDLQTQTLLAELKGLKEQFDLIVQQQIPLALKIQQRTLIGFKAGKLNVTDIQQATFQLHQARLQTVQILKSAWQKSLEVESLSLGIEPSQLMEKDALNQINQNLIQEINVLPVIGTGN